MFEKESKEYANKWLYHVKDLELHHKEDDKPEYIRILEAHQKGAEFGYNKAIDEMQEQGLALQSDMDKTIEQNIALKKELEKANEWHYVKDGDLPKEYDKPYLCKVYSHFEVGYFTAYKDQPWHFDEYYLDNEDVIAWKEIVLPKESE